jgi:hypothetical protein
MLARVVRIPFGFALASFAAAATLVLFVYAPGDWAGLRADLNGDRLSEAGYFALVITPWVAVCAAVPALIGVAFAETKEISGFMFYALVGVATAAIGFLFQHYSETPGGMAFFQSYTLLAFLTSGLVGGLVYWAASGRYAAT